LALGRVAAWGRDPSHGNSPPIKIKAAYWQKAHLTLRYFEVGFENQDHVQPLPNIEGPSYRDLRFNRAQVEAEWLPADRPKSAQTIGAVDAFSRILSDSKWASALILNPSKFEFEAPYPNSVSAEVRTKQRLIKQLDRDLHDKLRSGAISSTGRPHKDLPRRPIAKEEWDKIGLIFDQMALDNPQGKSFAKAFATNKICYAGVEFPKSDVALNFGVTI
jgi:hypothetical protein